LLAMERPDRGTGNLTHAIGCQRRSQSLVSLGLSSRCCGIPFLSSSCHTKPRRAHRPAQPSRTHFAGGLPCLT
jgi:hypothetical protein